MILNEGGVSLFAQLVKLLDNDKFHCCVIPKFSDFKVEAFSMLSYFDQTVIPMSAFSQLD